MGAGLSKERRDFAMQLFAKALNGRTQRELAEALGVSQAHVSRGTTRGEVAADVLAKVAILAGEDPQEALGVYGIVSANIGNAFERGRDFFLENVTQKGERKQAEEFLAKFLKGNHKGAESMTSGEWYEHLSSLYRGWRFATDETPALPKKTRGRRLE